MPAVPSGVKTRGLRMPVKSAVSAPRNSAGCRRRRPETPAGQGIDSSGNRRADFAAVSSFSSTGTATAVPATPGCPEMVIPVAFVVAPPVRDSPIKVSRMSLQLDRLHAEVWHAGDSRDDGVDNGLLVAGWLNVIGTLPAVLLLLSNSNVTVEGVGRVVRDCQRRAVRKLAAVLGGHDDHRARIELERDTVHRERVAVLRHLGLAALNELT